MRGLERCRSTEYFALNEKLVLTLGRNPLKGASKYVTELTQTGFFLILDTF